MGKYKNFNKWSIEELNYIVGNYKTKEDIAPIARQLKKSYQAVAEKLIELEMIKLYTIKIHN